MTKILATRYKIINGKIQLFDGDGNKVSGKDARWDGGFNCSSSQLTTLEGAPSEVGGGFDCSNNHLTTLEGAPSEVGGWFYCSRNQLTTLEGAPSEVGGGFDCSNNHLTTLEGAPSEVGGGFDCSSNKLTTLKGAPSEVGGWFNCSNNQLTTLEGAPSEVGGWFDCSNNQLTTLEGAPSEVGGGFDCSSNKLTTLKGAPSEVGGWFDCSNNQLTTLEGAPSEVGGWFDCSSNKLTTLKGAPKTHVNKDDISTGIKLKISLRIEAAFNLRGFSVADGILGRILSKKSGVTKIEKVGTKEILFVVGDGEGNFSHGETIKQAREDLAYKTIAKFDGELPEKATVREWIGIYRAVTGACSTGIKMFIEEKNLEFEKIMTAKEVSRVVSGRYGDEKFKELVA